MKEIVRILNLIFSFVFGFFTSNYFLGDMSQMWKLYVGLSALVCAVFSFIAYAPTNKKGEQLICI